MVAISLVLASLPSLAWADVKADTKAEAKRHFERAVELVEEGEFEKAIVEFKEAYELAPHYSVLYNLGQAHVGLGRPVEAVDYLKRYLEQGKGAISAARRAEVTREIERQKARIALLMIQVEPAEATVFVDGRPIPPAKLRQPVPVALGRRVLAAKLKGYSQVTQTVTVVGEERKSILLRLQPDQAPEDAQSVGQVVVQCELPDVSVRVDGNVVGTTPLAVPLLVPPGKHQLVLERAGYRPSEILVAVTPGGAESIGCDLAVLAPLPAAVAARLDVVPGEEGARITVDGAPYTGGDLPAGRHVVVVRRAGFETFEQEVELQPGQPRTLRAQLVPEPEFLADYQARARSQRTLAYVLGGTGLALAGATVATFLIADGKHADWQDRQDALDEEWRAGSNDPSLSSRQADNDDRLGSVQTLDQVTVGLGVAAGGLLASGAVLLLTGDDPEKYSSVTTGATRSGGWIGWRGTW